MKIGDLAKRTGLTAHTIRYYERIGLLPYADRDAGGHRDYDPSILDWIAFLGHLKSTGMPIRDMQRYAALRAEGDRTGPARRALLEAHRDAVRARIAGLRANLLVLDTKIGGYAEAEQRTQTHDHASDDPPGNPARPRAARAR